MSASGAGCAPWNEASDDGIKIEELHKEVTIISCHKGTEKTRAKPTRRCAGTPRGLRECSGLTAASPPPSCTILCGFLHRGQS